MFLAAVLVAFDRQNLATNIYDGKKQMLKKDVFYILFYMKRHIALKAKLGFLR